MRKTILVFSLLILAVLLLFKFSQYTIDSGNVKTEIVISVIAILFFSIGVYINKKSGSASPNRSHNIDHEQIKSLDITAREYEVLTSISEGLSNKEIGEKLFLSESTIKTHVSNLLLKLNAKRRTHAIQIAKRLKII